MERTIQGVLLGSPEIMTEYIAAFEQVTPQFRLALPQDVADPERVWVATMNGLWVVDGPGDATLEVPTDFSVRHLGQRQDQDQGDGHGS